MPHATTCSVAVLFLVLSLILHAWFIHQVTIYKNIGWAGFKAVTSLKKEKLRVYFLEFHNKFVQATNIIKKP